MLAVIHNSVYCIPPQWWSIRCPCPIWSQVVGSSLLSSASWSWPWPCQGAHVLVHTRDLAPSSNFCRPLRNMNHFRATPTFFVFGQPPNSFSSCPHVVGQWGNFNKGPTTQASRWWETQQSCLSQTPQSPKLSGESHSVVIRDPPASTSLFLLYP